ncbi:MAG: mechanosensitive ion channel family protein [Lentisphaeria bacterium]|nr:mechanosensitive ion channel family protein [Lentisphaeria bacterium]
MIPYALIAATAEAVETVASAAEKTAAAPSATTVPQKQSLLESQLNEADSVVRQIQEQGTGFFSNLWDKHSDDVIRFVKVVILTLVVLVAAKLISMAVRKIIARSFKKFEGDESLTHATYTIVRTLIWVIAMLIILDLFGFNTASILTVLGAAGLAIGLAMKDSLSNIAAGIMLLILRPYKLGDYIDCGSVSGTIQQMGLFSTVLKTPDGLFISAPNSVVFGTPIKNYSRNPTRRSDITVGIAYADSLPVAVKALMEIMEQEPMILKDPAPEVLVAELADSSVQLTLRYWTATENYWPAYWTVKAQLKPAIEKAGLNIPFPQRVVTFVNAPDANAKPGA